MHSQKRHKASQRYLGHLNFNQKRHFNYLHIIATLAWVCEVNVKCVKCILSLPLLGYLRYSALLLQSVWDASKHKWFFMHEKDSVTTFLCESEIRVQHRRGLVALWNGKQKKICRLIRRFSSKECTNCLTIFLNQKFHLSGGQGQAIFVILRIYFVRTAWFPC